MIGTLFTVLAAVVAVPPSAVLESWTVAGAALGPSLPLGCLW